MFWAILTGIDVNEAYEAEVEVKIRGPLKSKKLLRDIMMDENYVEIIIELPEGIEPKFEINKRTGT